jgi:hypothetical protein
LLKVVVYWVWDWAPNLVTRRSIYGRAIAIRVSFRDLHGGWYRFCCFEIGRNWITWRMVNRSRLRRRDRRSNCIIFCRGWSRLVEREDKIGRLELMKVLV